MSTVGADNKDNRRRKDRYKRPNDKQYEQEVGYENLCAHHGVDGFPSHWLSCCRSPRRVVYSHLNQRNFVIIIVRVTLFFCSRFNLKMAKALDVP